MKKPEMITQSTVISMGWTKTMISKLLPPPVEKRNPYYGSAAPMKLWDKEKVEAVMQTEDYANEYAKAQKRKKSAQKATATRAERLTEKMNKMGDTILVGIMDDEELVQTVLKEKEWQIKAKMENELEYMYRRGLHGSDELYEYESLSDEIDYYEFHMPSKEVLDRWVVNYIRHNLIDYSGKDFSMTLSNRYRLNDALSIFEDGYGNTASIASVTANHAVILEEQKKQINALEIARQQSLNYTKQAILSAEKQEITVDDSGMTIKTVTSIDENGTRTYDPYQFKLANGSILFTEDGWQTAGLAVGKYYDPRSEKWRMGINGEHIMANTIEASSLTVGLGDSASGTNVLKDGSFDGDPNSAAFAWHDDSIHRENMTINGITRTVEFMHLDTAQSFSFTVSGFALQKKTEYLVAHIRGAASTNCTITHANNSKNTITNTCSQVSFTRCNIIQLPTSVTNEVVDLDFCISATGQGLDLFGITIGVQNEPFVFSDQKGENLVVCGGFEKAVSNAWDAYTYNPTQRKFNQAGFDQVTTNNVVVLYDSLLQTPRISAPRQSNGTYAAAVQLYSGGDNEDIADVMLCSKSPIRLESGQEYTFSCDLSFGETATDRVTSENKTLYVPIHVALMTKNALGLIKDGTIDFDELISYQACLELLSQERQYYCDYKYTLSNGFTAQLNGASNFFNNDLYLVFYFKFSDMGFVAPDSLSSMYAYFDKVSITSSAYTGGYYENGYNVLSAQSFSDYGIPSATVPLLSANGYDGGSMLTVSQNHDISSDMFRVFGSLPYYISAYVIGSGQINIRWYSSESPSSLIKTETLSFENIAAWERISKKCIAPENACNVAVCLISNSATANYDGVLLEQSAFLNAYSDHISEQFSKHTKIDDNGISVYNGAIKIYNNNGIPVFWGDQNGNLELVGNITASSGHIAGWEIQTDRLSAIDNAGQITSVGEFISGDTENENDYFSKIQNGKYEMYETGQSNSSPKFVGGIYGDGSAFQTAVGKYSISRPFGILGQNGVIIAKKDGNSDDQVAVFSDNIFLNKDIGSDIKIANGGLYLKSNSQTHEALSLYGSSLALGDSNHELDVMASKTLFTNDVGVMGTFKCNEPMYCQGNAGSVLYRVVTEDMLAEKYNELVEAINSIRADTANSIGSPSSGSTESGTTVRTVETYNSAQWDNLWVKMRSATNGSGDKYAYPGENGNPTSAIGFASGGRSNCYALAQWQYDNNRSPSYTYRRNPYSVSDPVNRNLYDNNTYNIWADEANASNLKRSYPTS